PNGSGAWHWSLAPEPGTGAWHRSLAPVSGTSGRHSDDQLAEVLALQKAEERGWRVVEAVDDVLAVFDPAGAHERRHLLQKRRTAVGMVADDEAANHRAVHEQRPQVRSARHLRRVVFGDQPAQRNACAAIQALHDRGQHRAADVLEVDVDAIGTRGLQRGLQIVGLVVEARVEPELVDDVPALLRGSGDANRPASFDLRKLADDRTDGPRRGGDDDGFARLRLTDVQQSDVGRHARHAQDAQRRRLRYAPIEDAQLPAVRDAE